MSAYLQWMECRTLKPNIDNAEIAAIVMMCALKLYVGIKQDARGHMNVITIRFSAATLHVRALNALGV